MLSDLNGRVKRIDLSAFSGEARLDIAAFVTAELAGF
jgi:hypothetical protein